MCYLVLLRQTCSYGHILSADPYWRQCDKVASICMEAQQRDSTSGEVWNRLHRDVQLKASEKPFIVLKKAYPPSLSKPCVACADKIFDHKRHQENSRKLEQLVAQKEVHESLLEAAQLKWNATAAKDLWAADMAKEEKAVNAIEDQISDLEDSMKADKDRLWVLEKDILSNALDDGLGPGAEHDIYFGPTEDIEVEVYQDQVPSYKKVVPRPFTVNFDELGLWISRFSD